MWQLKGCPKCGGDVFADWDSAAKEWHRVCLQCSHRSYVGEKAEETESGIAAEPAGSFSGGDREWLKYWESTLEQLTPAWR